MIPQFMDMVRAGAWSPTKGVLNIGLMLFVILSVLTLILMAAARWVAVLRGVTPIRTADQGSGTG